jgi:type VI protein secretion system component VasK
MQFRLTLAVAITAVLSPPLIHAQTTRSGNADVRVMQQLQQATAEKTKLEAENADLKHQLDDLKKKLDKTSAQQNALQQRAKALETVASRESSSTQQNNEALEKSRAQMQELVTKFRETAQTLREVESDRNEVKSQLSAREREFKTCVDRNAGLYFLGEEMLDRLEHKGVWASIKESEPFTQISRTRLENLVDDYRARVEELRLAKKSASR